MHFVKENIKDCIPIFIFIGAVFFTHLPFFIYTPIPQFDMDTFGYFHMAQLMSQGIPVGDLPIDMPMGYSLFVLVIKTFGGNLLTITYIQTLLYLVAGSYAVYSFHDYKKSWGWAAAIAFALFTFHPFVLRYNITLYTEGIYLSSLIFLTGSIIRYFTNNTTRNFVWICFAVLLGLTIRSNGIVLLLIPIFILAYEKWKVRTTIKRKVLTALLVIILPQLLLNGYFKHQLAFSESNRILKVFNSIASNPLPQSNSETINSHWSRSEMYEDYFLNFPKPKPSYYYSLSPTQYDRNVKEQWQLSADLHMYDAKYKMIDIAPDLRNYIFADYDYSRFDSPYYSSFFDFEAKKSIWMYLVHLGYEIQSKARLYWGIFFLFWLALLYYSYKLIQDRFNVKSFFILLSCQIHLVPLIILPFAHGRFQARYIFVSEFIVFLIAGFFIVDVILSNIKKQKSIAH